MSGMVGNTIATGMFKTLDQRRDGGISSARYRRANTQYTVSATNSNNKLQQHRSRARAELTLMPTHTWRRGGKLLQTQVLTL
jgi:predicted metal-dependent RNase